MKCRVLDDVVLSKIRDRFGGRLRAGFVAGAACPAEVVDFMDAIGIPVCEGYGLTETSPVIALNVLSRRRAGSVGRVLGGVNVWILDSEGNALGPGEEGEICCSGPNVMKGYHNNSDATDEVITIAPDGKSKLFHTGDLGKMDSDGFLSVTGRIKEQYKLENGKYVCPTPIEEAIGMSRFVSQVVVCGANRPHNVALVVPDWAAIRSQLGISESDSSEEDLANNARVKGLISAEIKLNCYKIKKFEVPVSFVMVSPFTAANNMVTPKMSIRRHVVLKTYDDMISQLYEESVGSFSGNISAEDLVRKVA
jgi:long-chain acyl-CoA synthetase